MYPQQRTMSEQRAFERSARRGAILREIDADRAAYKLKRQNDRAARRARWAARFAPRSIYIVTETTINNCWPSAVVHLNGDLVSAPGAYEGESIQDVFARAKHTISERHSDGSRYRIKYS